MAYQVIARKWRPQAFADVVGQPHITQTLTNAFKNNRIPHALLFTGPRGTGKTSSARILAKLLRCTYIQNFVPCNKCSACIEITQGSSVDVIEIDGASNNGVDAIRELRETVAFMPSSGKYKIYIIDEVHMLSTSAFNALLKTLEEPPAHVVFVLATTEVHKIPQTILSRCQRFDFRRIPTRQIVEKLRIICQKEDIPFDESALWVIARQGDGSMRDSQSLLDQVITFANGPLAKSNVTEILGLTDHTLIIEAIQSLLSRDNKQTLKVLEKLSNIGTEPELFAKELLESIRNLILIKVAQEETTSILDLPDTDLVMFKELVSHQSEEDLHLVFDMLTKGIAEISRSQEPRLILEILLLRIASSPNITDLKTLLASASEAPRRDARPALAKAAQPANKAEEKPSFINAANPTDKWLLFVQKIKELDALFAAKIENLLFVEESSKVLTLSVPLKHVFLKEQMNDTASRKKLQGFIDSFWGDGYSFQITAGKKETAGAPVGESAQSMANRKQQEAESDLKKIIEDNPLVKKAQAVFRGEIKEIKSITGLKGN